MSIYTKTSQTRRCEPAGLAYHLCPEALPRSLVVNRALRDRQALVEGPRHGTHFRARSRGVFADFSQNVREVVVARTWFMCFRRRC